MKSKRCKLSSALRVFAILTLILGFGIILFESYMIFLTRIYTTTSEWITSLFNILGFGSLFTLSIATTLHGLSFLLDYKMKVIEKLHNTKINLLKTRAIMVTITVVLSLIIFLSELTGLIQTQNLVTGSSAFSILTLPCMFILIICSCISWTTYMFINKEKSITTSIILKVITVLFLIIGIILLALGCFSFANYFQIFDSYALISYSFVITFGFLCIVVVTYTLYGLSKLLSERKASRKYLLTLKISSILGVILMITPILLIIVCLFFQNFDDPFEIVIGILFILGFSLPIMIALFLCACALGVIRRILKLNKVT